MSTVALEEKKIELDEDGYIIDIDKWDIKVAEFLAQREGIELTAEHWRIITAIRLYYERTGISPLCGKILKELGLSKNDMYRLFPSGHIRGAYKLAGLPKPSGCN